MSVPLPISPGREGFAPPLSLSYDSGSGNGPFGFGWTLSLPAISRKTDKGLPQYHDAGESDVYVLSGVDELVPLLQPAGSRFEDDTTFPGFTIHRYRPRIEGLFARIAAETLCSLLIEAVRSRLGRPGQTWAQLSGGVDSSSVVSLTQWLVERGGGSRCPT